MASKKGKFFKEQKNSRKAARSKKRAWLDAKPAKEQRRKAA